MRHLQIILPFAIPPAPLAPDLLRELRLPCLNVLVGKAQSLPLHRFDDYARQLPHEFLMAGHDVTKTDLSSEAISSSPAETHNRMQQFGLEPNNGHWFTLSPVHIHIARDHLVLTDQRRLTLTDIEARALFDDAASLCVEAGHTLLYGDAKTWFLRADDWRDLRTASLDAACGHNVDIWSAKGSHELAWRKLQNEIQMQWFIHPLNEARAARGEQLINSVWLSGGTSAPISLPKILPATSSLSSIVNNFSGERSEQTLLLDQLLEPALNSDWSEWLTQMHALENDCFAPLLQALKENQLTRLTLIATDASCIAPFTLSKWHLRQFWKPASITSLFSLGSI